MVRTPICDKATAFCAAQAPLRAVRVRAGVIHGTTRAARCSMRASTRPDLYWNHTFLDAEGPPSPDLADLFAVSKTSDGWVAAVTDPRLRRHDHRGALAMLDRPDAPCAPVNALAEVLEDPPVPPPAPCSRAEHPDAGRLRQGAGPCVRPRRTPANFVRRPAPAPGADGAPRRRLPRRRDRRSAAAGVLACGPIEGGRGGGGYRIRSGGRCRGCAAIRARALLAPLVVYGGGGGGMMLGAMRPSTPEGADRCHPGQPRRAAAAHERLSVTAGCHAPSPGDRAGDARKARMRAGGTCAVLPGGIGTMDELFEAFATWGGVSAFHTSSRGIINGLQRALAPAVAARRRPARCQSSRGPPERAASPPSPAHAGGHARPVRGAYQTADACGRDCDAARTSPRCKADARMNIGHRTHCGAAPPSGLAAHAASGGRLTITASTRSPFPQVELVERCEAYRESLAFSRKQIP